MAGMPRTVLLRVKIIKYYFCFDFILKNTSTNSIQVLLRLLPDPVLHRQHEGLLPLLSEVRKAAGEAQGGGIAGLKLN